ETLGAVIVPDFQMMFPEPCALSEAEVVALRLAPSVMLPLLLVVCKLSVPADIGPFTLMSPAPFTVSPPSLVRMPVLPMLRTSELLNVVAIEITPLDVPDVATNCSVPFIVTVWLLLTLFSKKLIGFDVWKSLSVSVTWLGRFSAVRLVARR